MTAAYRSIFDSADWIAALDRQLAAPPEPPADEPMIEPLASPAPVTWEAPTVRYKRLRNWQIALVISRVWCGLVVTGLGLLETYAGARNALPAALLTLALHAAALVIGLAVGIPLNRRRYP